MATVTAFKRLSVYNYVRLRIRKSNAATNQFINAAAA
ncbi:MAG: hypothetical protein ACI915_003632 [Gammaproteobacteria bacterium]|jgi:hypothetical protein